MRHLFAIFATAVVVSVAMVSPPVRTAAADGQAPAPAPTPAPTPPAPHAPDCAACVQCVAGCATAYADCTGKCVGQPDFPSKQACIAQCPPVAQCAQACPCTGCVGVPGMPH